MDPKGSFLFPALFFIGGTGSEECMGMQGTYVGRTIGDLLEITLRGNRKEAAEKRCTAPGGGEVEGGEGQGQGQGGFDHGHRTSPDSDY